MGDHINKGTAFVVTGRMYLAYDGSQLCLSLNMLRILLLQKNRLLDVLQDFQIFIENCVVWAFVFQPRRPLSCSDGLVGKGYSNSGREVPRVTEFCAMVPNVCGFSLWNLLHATLLASRILRWLLVYLNIY